MRNSSPNKRDLRVRRTQKLLQDALIELIKERNFETITVGDITKRAMVNRATFYRHYQDKYDLAERILEEASFTLNQELGPPQNELHNIPTEPVPEPWLHFFEYIAQHATFYRALLGKNGGSWFSSHLRERIINEMNEREQRRERLAIIRKPSIHSERMPREIATLMTANLFVSTITWWLEDGQSYSPEQMIRWLRQFILHGYTYALGSAKPE